MTLFYKTSTNLEHNITNIILVDASESLNGSRVEAYAKGDIRLYVICLIFAYVLLKLLIDGWVTANYFQARVSCLKINYRSSAYWTVSANPLDIALESQSIA